MSRVGRGPRTRAGSTQVAMVRFLALSLACLAAVVSGDGGRAKKLEHPFKFKTSRSTKHVDLVDKDVVIGSCAPFLESFDGRVSYFDELAEANVKQMLPLVLSVWRGGGCDLDAPVTKDGQGPNGPMTGRPAAWIAAGMGDLLTLEMLIAVDVDVGRAFDGSSPLHVAAARDQVEVVELLLDWGLDVDMKAVEFYVDSSEALTPLWAASSRGAVRTIELLVGRGADLDAGSTRDHPLHVAAQHSHAGALKVLLDAGASVDVSGMDDYTPLMYAVSNIPRDRGDAASATEAVNVLIAHGADLHAYNKQGMTPLITAVGHGNVVGIRSLIAAGADVDADFLAKLGGKLDYRTPLFMAATMGDEAVMTELLRSGASAERALFALRRFPEGTIFGDLEIEEIIERLQDAGDRHRHARVDDAAIEMAQRLPASTTAGGMSGLDGLNRLLDLRRQRIGRRIVTYLVGALIFCFVVIGFCVLRGRLAEAAEARSVAQEAAVAEAHAAEKKRLRRQRRGEAARRAARYGRRRDDMAEDAAEAEDEKDSDEAKFEEPEPEAKEEEAEEAASTDAPLDAPPDAGLAALLASLGLSALLPRFVAEDVDDAETLLCLTDEDLAELGVPDGARRAILEAARDQQGGGKKVVAQAEIDGAAVHQARLEASLCDHRAELARLKDVLGTIPDAFICPISCETMKDPVLSADGFTYERVCIELCVINH